MSEMRNRWLSRSECEKEWKTFVAKDLQHVKHFNCLQFILSKYHEV